DSQHLGSAIWQAYLDGNKVINISWGGHGNIHYASAMPVIESMKEMTQNGTTLVFAAGNDTSSISHNSYADIPGIINVGGVNYENKIGPTGFARNQWVDLCAPGDGVYVASGAGDNLYEIAS